MIQSRLLLLALTSAVLLMGVVSSRSVLAQPPEVLKKIEEAKAAALRKHAESAGGDKSKSKDKPDGKKSDGDAKDGDSKDKKKDDDKPKVVTRPEADKNKSVDMSVLNSQVGRDGMVRFNLEGVPWPDLLRWLADASRLSLDWQELPADALNLRTQRSYSIEEARDVINRHLLSRGYTLLLHGELLSVVKIETLNTGLVPRVRPEDLDERMPHEFVKVSFPLDWLVAEKAVEELKPMLSPNGKLTPLISTNRIEAIDAVVNLIEVRTILSEEQTTTGDKRIVDVFRLKHIKAKPTVLLLEQILGLETNRGMMGGVDNNSGRQIMQQLQQMQRNMQNSSGAKKSGGKGGEQEDPKLIVNERENSIVVHAPPDKMEIVRQTVTALDTPSGTTSHLLQNLQRMKVYRLSTLEPEPLMQILQELGDFSPSTKIQADNGTLIVFGTLEDHITIQTLVDKLDGSNRNFEVIQLRRLAADEVAGTIQYMLGEEEDDDNKSSGGFFSYYRYGRGNGNDTKKDEKRPFKIDADIENNRLLIWANEVELAEVQNLLIKMGEMPSGKGSDETFRVIDLSSDENADEVLRRIREMWPNIAPNELQIQGGPTDPTTNETKPSPSGAAPADKARPADDTIRTTATDVAPTHPLLIAKADAVDDRVVSDRLRSAANHSALATSESAMRPNRVRPGHRPSRRLAQRPTSTVAAPSTTNVPPVIIQRGPNGKLILTSPDARALDQLELMVGDIAPPRKDYHIFRLRYTQTWAYGVELNLKDFFKDEMNSGTPTLDWYGGIVNRKESGPTRLSRRRQLKIISDADSRTILVQGATPSQLATISDLIELYDQPTTSDPQSMRATKFFHLKYSNATVIGETLKSVYRDLLSTNDPALRDPNNEKNKPQNTGTTMTYVYNRGGTGGDEEGEEPSRIQFKGLLSVGVDEVSNVLVVSAIEGLMPDISELVETLDEAARPSGNFKVISLDPSINPALVQARLQKLLESQRKQKTNQNGKNATQNGGQAGAGGGKGNPGGPN